MGSNLLNDFMQQWIFGIPLPENPLCLLIGTLCDFFVALSSAKKEK